MKKFWHTYDTLLKGLIMITSGSFVFLVLLQVFCRYILRNSLAWSEEVCKLLFFATIMFGAAVCVTEKRHIAIDILPMALSKAGKRWLFLGIYISIFLIGLYMIFFGYTFALGNMKQATPALRLSYGRVYMITPVSMILLCINVIRAAILDWTVTYAPGNGETKVRMA